MEFNINNLKAITAGKETAATKKAARKEKMDNFVARTTDAAKRSADYLTGLAPTTRRRFEDEREVTLKRDLTINEKVDFLYEVLGIDQLSAEELQAAVEDKFEDIRRQEAEAKELAKKERKQKRADAIARAKSKLNLTRPVEEQQEEESVEVTVDDLMSTDKKRSQAAFEAVEAEEAQDVEEEIVEEEVVEEEATEEPAQEEPSQPVGTTRRMRIQFDN